MLTATLLQGRTEARAVEKGTNKLDIQRACQGAALPRLIPFPPGLDGSGLSQMAVLSYLARGQAFAPNTGPSSRLHSGPLDRATKSAGSNNLHP